MDFEFYNADPPRGLRASLLRPFRRLLRRVQRPYFHRLRDLLQWLFDRQREQGRRQDDLTAHLDAVHQQHRAAEERQQARIEQLERAVAHLTEALAASRHEKAIFQVDYLAVTRRLARLEDLLLEVLANPPAAACDAPGPSLAKIAS